MTGAGRCGLDGSTPVSQATPLDQLTTSGAIRVLSVEPHSKFTGKQFKAFHADGWATWQEDNYIIDRKTGGILETDDDGDGPDGWGEGALKTQTRHDRLERAAAGEAAAV